MVLQLFIFRQLLSRRVVHPFLLPLKALLLSTIFLWSQMKLGSKATLFLPSRKTNAFAVIAVDEIIYAEAN